MEMSAMTETLRDFITKIDQRICNIFDLTGEVHGMWHAVSASGEHVLPALEWLDKDDAAMFARAFFMVHNVTRYVFISEAWQLLLPNMVEVDKATKAGLENHPDRVEVLMYCGEDSETGQITAQREIRRPPTGKAVLGPLEFQEHEISQGRMVGMLPRKGTVQ
jgi:hypothetical protein